MMKKLRLIPPNLNRAVKSQDILDSTAASNTAPSASVANTERLWPAAE